MAKSPELLDETVLAETRIFKVMGMHLRFSNGHEYHFEKILVRESGAVMVIPMLDNETIVLIREYAAAAGEYVLGFPKGAIDEGEDLLETANRELMEEAGYGANELTHFSKFSLSPAYFNAEMQIVLAKDLYPKRLEGDEPEPIEVVHWKLNDIDALLAHPEFHESRSIAGLLLLERTMRG